MSLVAAPCPSVQFDESWDQTGEAVCEAALDMLEDDVRPPGPFTRAGDVDGYTPNATGVRTWRFTSPTHHMYVTTKTPARIKHICYLTSVQVLRI